MRKNKPIIIIYLTTKPHKTIITAQCHPLTEFQSQTHLVISVGLVEIWILTRKRYFSRFKCILRTTKEDERVT